MLNLLKLRNIFICLINKEYQYVGWLGSPGKSPLFDGKDPPPFFKLVTDLTKDKLKFSCT